MKHALRLYLDHIIVAALAVVCYVLFFHSLGDIGLIGPDEPRYAAVAREMFLTGDYITPHLYGVPWFEKPPLMYWLAALSYKVFGVGETGARFPSAVGATISVFLVFWCARRIWNRTIALMAALVLATSIGFFAFARAASMDMPLSTCLTAALAFFLVANNDKTPQRRNWFYAFYAALGVGVLAKGPIALVLPALALAGFMLLRRQPGEWRTWNPKGLWITAAVAMPWFVACTIIHGWHFINTFFINQNIQRFVTTIHGHGRPFYFFIPVLLMLTFPWTFLLISALHRTLGKNEQILACWAVVPFIFFSLAGSKLPGYILPMVAPIALLCGKELLQPVSRPYKVAVFVEAGTMAFIGVAFGFFGNTLNVDPHVSGMLIAVITFMMAAVLSIIALWLTPVFLAVFNATAIIAVVIIGTTMIFPRFDASDTMRPWSDTLPKIVPDNQVVFLYKPPRWMEYGLQFYRSNQVRSVFSADELVQVTATEPRVLCVAEDKTMDEINHVANIDVEVVNTSGSQTAFWVWQVK